MSPLSKVRRSTAENIYLVILLINIIWVSSTESSASNFRSCCSYQNTFDNRSCSLSKNGNLEEFPIQHSVLERYLQKYWNGNEDVENGFEETIRLEVDDSGLSCDSDSVSELLLGNGDWSTDVQSETRLLRNGYLKHRNHSYRPEEFCIDRLNGSSLVLFYCEMGCSNNNNPTNMETWNQDICLPKCCPSGNLLSISKSKVECVHAGTLQWTPTLYKDVRTVSPTNIERRVQFRYAPPRTLCAEGIFQFQTPFLQYPKTPFRILENGRVIRKERSHWLEITTGSYCIEGIYPEDNQGTLEPVDGIKDLVFRCWVSAPDENEFPGDWNGSSYQLGILIGSYISAFFVLLTILVYLLLWEKQNFHGWTLLCSFASLFSLYVHLGLMHTYHLVWRNHANKRTALCWTIGIGLHFSYLSFFSWASVVNFDLWYTFRKLRTVNQNKRRVRRFLKYAFFGLGLPLGIICLSLTFDLLYRNNELVDYFLPDPDYGSDKCFLARNESPLAYLLAPIGTLLTANSIFFFATVYSVHNAQLTASIAVNSSSRTHKQSLKLFGKLLVVMGVLWAFDVLSFLLSRDSVPWYFGIFDVLNVCHGVFIFIIFVCKTSTLRSLEQKYTQVAKLSQVIGEWKKWRSGCCTYFPNQITRLLTVRYSIGGMRGSGRSKRSSQSDHVTETSHVPVASTAV